MLLSYPSELPITKKKDEIVRTVRDSRVVVLAGDTGSGKTTQITKMCLEAGRGKEGLIGCTQPRRIAAVSVAERVAEELGDDTLVGYKIRFNDRTSKQTKIKFMTDGILLAETRNDRDLNNYDTLIIDEAHERSLNIDYLLGYIKTLLDRRPGLKLIIASATIDTGKFSKHFANAPIINVSGRTHPIAMEYRTPNDDGTDAAYVDQAVEEAVGLTQKSPAGDILIFMPTERDILDCIKMLEGRLKDKAVALPLFGRLHSQNQRKVFLPSRLRKVIVATNIAETSITVPGIKYVIDSGLARISRYNPRARTTSLQVGRISRASCDQRAGRCGRTGPGRCIRLYSEEDYRSREEYTQPEIQRSSLAEVILQMISLRLGEPRDFPFIDPPSANAVRDGLQILREINGVTADGKLTRQGRIMAELPLDPCISKIIIEAAENGALREIKIIAAGLSIQDPRIRPPEQEHKAGEAHARFIDKTSDFLTLLNIWEHFRSTAGKAGSKSRLKKFCATHFLSWQRMREWEDIHDQINRLLKHNRGFRDNEQPASFEAVHQSLLSGFLRNIGQKKEKNIYTISGGREIMIFPGSSLFNKAGQWIVCSSFMETSRLYGMTAASIDPLWLERLGGELCRFSWSEPRWEKKSGQVTALEKVSLFGLVIVPARKVNFAGTDPKNQAEAREIFIREALVAGNLGGRYTFLQHNTDLIQRLLDMEQRTRRRDILVDEETIYNFYDQRLGMTYDRHTLNRLLKQRRNDRFLWMTEEDVMQANLGADELYRYPETLNAGEHAIRLEYCFEPGDEADGVTADIPLPLVQHFNQTIFEWLTPGLLEEKILALLKGLPKQLRRRLVPLPDAAARIMDGLELYQDTLYGSLEKTILNQFQLTVKRTDWQPGKLPAHLKMRFRLLDENNKVLLASRSYRDLLDKSTMTAAQPFVARGKGNAPKVIREIRTWDFPEPPRPIAQNDKQNMLAGFLYPMLEIDQVNRCLELHYTTDLEKSLRANRQGLRFLYGLRFPTEIKALARECKQAVAGHSASWLSLGMEGTASAISARLHDFLLDGIFHLRPGELPSAEEYEANIAEVKRQGFIKMIRTRLDLLLGLLVQRRQLISRIEAVGQKAKGKTDPLSGLYDQFLDHLQGLLPSDFLTSRELAELQQVPRYLKALEIRMERAAHSPAKDIQKNQLATKAANRLANTKNFDNSKDCLRCLAEYREMVEEYRISVFAPELGTLYPVSEKRLKTKWQEVENQCHRVE